MRLAIFDFCDTLVNFQTADEFCKYVLKKESKYSFLKIDRFFESYYLYRLFSKLGFSRLSQKRLLLRGLKGLTRSKIEFYGEQFVQDRIENQLNRDVFQRLLAHIEAGDIVVINSGGYEAYLLHFSHKHKIEFTFSTQFKYVNDIFSGEIHGNDCLGREKIRRMNDTNLLGKSYSDIYVYSDSVTDTPIFDLATRRVAVIKHNTTPKWCQSNFGIIKL